MRSRLSLISRNEARQHTRHDVEGTRSLRRYSVRSGEDQHRASSRRCSMTARETLLTANFDKIMRSWKEMIRNLVLEGYTLKQILDLLTAAIYANALLAAGNNQCKAALSLGIHRNTLHRKLAEHGLLPKAHTKR